MSVVIFNNTFDENALPLSNITLRRAKYIDQSRAGGISAITGSCIEIHRHFVYFVVRIHGSDVTNFNQEKCYDIFRL